MIRKITKEEKVKLKTQEKSMTKIEKKIQYAVNYKDTNALSSRRSAFLTPF